MNQTGETGPADEAFNQAAYWVQRHAQYAGDARSVGNLALSHEQNLAGDRLVAQFLSQLCARLRPRSILDLGCGYGRACASLTAGSLSYHGVDVSSLALAAARRDYPAFTFEHANLVTWRPSRRYDLVLLTYTLSCFPSDADWLAVLRHALDSLSDDGTLVIQDFMPEQREQKVKHVAYRGRLDYDRVLAARGFQWDPRLRELCLADRMGGVLAKESRFIRSTKAAPLSLPATPAVALPARPMAAAAPEPKAAAPRAERGARPRMLVVSWDMAHNPVGRGYLLADMARAHFEVSFTGASFPQLGKGLWPPIRGLVEIPTTTFEGGAFPVFLRHALDLVARHDPDVVYVSKPRLPSLLIGMLFRLLKGSAFLLDVDDHELAFVANRTPLPLDAALAAAEADPAGTAMPFSEVWTRFGETLAVHADAITVSNPALQRRFGGGLVRHGRNERQFRADPEVRARVRREFGLLPGDVAIVFIGTPRPHKGIFRIAEALERINDDRLVFVVIGTIRDARIRQAFAGFRKARIRFFGDQPWERLPELIQMADQVALLQDPASPIAEYQVPAKLTDALAIGLPAIVTRVPPLADIIAQGVVTVVDDDAGLDRALRAAIPYEHLPPAEIARIRGIFEAEFSFSVNAARIAKAERIAAEASANPTSPLLAETVLRIAEHYQVEHPLLDRIRRLAAPVVIRRDRPLDIVFFWKQNDSDLYGRRSDMMVKYLLQSGRVGRILHFDRVLSLKDLERNLDHGKNARLHQGNLVYLNTMRRVLRMADSPKLMRRSFLCRDGNRPQTALGQELPARQDYPHFVRAAMREAGFDRSAIAWVCPVVFDFPEIQSEIGFGGVIADLIDDQRKWPAEPDQAQRVTRNYTDILGSADLVIANCEPLRESFAHLRPDIRVVPNGAEIFPPGQSWDLPEDMGSLPGPRIGYVGNLRDRVDLELLEAMAQRHPEWSIVLVGSAHEAPAVIALAARIPNIHLLGVRPYQEALAYIRHFDVAIMPHLANDLSGSMNPLKLYVYAALGVPIVCSDVANINDIRPYAAVASTHAAFIQAVETALNSTATPRPGMDLATLSRMSWPARVTSILDQFDRLGGTKGVRRP